MRLNNEFALSLVIWNFNSDKNLQNFPFFPFIFIEMIRKKLPMDRLVPRLDLRPCRNCQRTFCSDRLSVHERICKKLSSKRPIFDSAKKRMSGTMLENFLQSSGRRQLQWRRGGGSYIKQKYAPSKNNWRQTHEELIQAFRNAREVARILKTGGNISNLPAPPPSLNPDYVQCPHCLRRFNENAGNRHIPQCANYRHNKAGPNQPAKKPQKR